MKTLNQVFKKSFKDFINKKGFTLAAAMAYYSMITAIPFIIFIIVFSSIFFGDSVFLINFITYLQGLGGENIAELIMDLIDLSRERRITSLVSFILTITGSTILFAYLKNLINNLWDIETKKPESKRELAKSFIFNRIKAILIIFMTIFLLAFFSILTFIVNSLTNLQIFRFSNTLNIILLNLINYSIFFIILTIFFLLIYRTFPSKKIKSTNLLIGSSFTSLFFMIGFLFIGIYFNISSIYDNSNYMATTIALLILFYYLSIIFIFGVIFTKNYALKKYFFKLPNKPQSI